MFRHPGRLPAGQTQVTTFKQINMFANKIHHATSIILIFILFPRFGQSQSLQLKVAGDARSGFHVNIYDHKNMIVTNDGEFTLKLSNLDLSANETVPCWKGARWSGNDSSITLKKEMYLPAFDANLSTTVTYEVVNPNIIKKVVTLFQSSMPGMYYTLEQGSKAVQPPLKYVTFEHDSFPGGLVHEMFPSVGFVTPDHQVVGFLTDAGYKNHYTRTTRRRFSGRGGGFVGMRQLPDPALVSIDGFQDDNLPKMIKQTFGEVYDLDDGRQLTLKLNKASYKKVGKLEASVTDSLLSLHFKSSHSGIEFITPIKDQKIYTISFSCKGNTAVALKLFRIKNGRKTVELENGIKYIDHFPCNDDQWTFFKGSIFVPYIENDSVSLFIGTQCGKDSSLQIKDLKIVENSPKVNPYNVLRQGDTIEKTTYIFVEPWKSHQQFIISSQSRLAEGMGFEGSLIEKMLYANMKMLTWITSVRDFQPFNVPNMNYMPDMYNRDAFFSIVSTYNKELNLGVWHQWANTQVEKGAIGTIITPYMGSVEVKDNEATIEWLIWAMLNKRRFGVPLPKNKIRLAVDYVLNEFDPERNGICKSHFPMNQIDVIEYNPKTTRLAVNQGMFAVALRTIQELGYDIKNEYIARAEEEYRKFYDPKRKHILFDKNYPDLISLTDLEPEFLSLWLFNHPILTDEMVINQLSRIPVFNKRPDSPHPQYGTTAPILIRLTNDEKGYAYLSKDYQPFEKFGEENYSDGRNDGFYYNGGSWFRAEYCAYVAGLRHGWDIAKKRMENRVWAEIYLNPEMPYSKEFIPTKYSSTASWWPSTRGLCWNVFILMANEVAGLRTPDMDPDFDGLLLHPNR